MTDEDFQELLTRIKALDVRGADCAPRTGSECVGLDDIHGRPVREGDEVILYAQNYASTLIEGGEVPIYEEDHTKPRPVADVPLVRGSVSWSTEMLCWGVDVVWVTPTWETRPCWLRLGGGSYAVEVITPNTERSNREP